MWCTDSKQSAAPTSETFIGSVGSSCPPLEGTGCDVPHAPSSVHASAPLSRRMNLEIMCVP
jgi:hypothetical protein